ncbi:MAG: hypothetical protein ACRED3_07455 [Bradyrhizobium sp.]
MTQKPGTSTACSESAGAPSGNLENGFQLGEYDFEAHAFRQARSETNPDEIL